MNKWRDMWFYYKVVATFLILGGLLALYLYHMITQTWVRGIEYHPFSYLLFQGQFLSFFTFQSNFIIGVWFLIASIYHHKKNRLIDNQNITLAVTCYISVTCFVFVAILFPGFLLSKQTVKVEDMITGPFFHILTPILMVVYSFFHVKAMKFNSKQYYFKSFLLYLIYPWVYTIYLMLRLIIYSSVPSLSSIPLIIVYPYAFNISDNTMINEIGGNIFGIVFFFLIVHFLFLIFNLIYFFTFKKLAQKK